MSYSPFFRPQSQPAKAKVFVSYQHSNDQYWYNQFAHLFGETYELFTDTSVDREINSDDATYIDRKIREDHITGSSITIVLCGPETWKRKYVDWEIHATLEKEHALLGIALPTASQSQDSKVIVPGRFYDNFQSGFAHWIAWTENASEVAAAIAEAKRRAENTSLIRNGRQQMGRNLS